jgi:hypothetical protein
LHRPGDAITLRHLAAQLQQRRTVCYGLHTFSNNLAPKRRGQPDDALQDGQVIWIVQRVTHKALIDLGQRNAQALEVGE